MKDGTPFHHNILKIKRDCYWLHAFWPDEFSYTEQSNFVQRDDMPF